MSGVCVVVSVHLGSRSTRRHTQLLCPLCEHNTHNTNNTHNTQTAGNTHSTHKNYSTLNLYSVSSPTVHKECTCGLVRTEERWVVRAYDPLTCVTYTKVLEMREVRSARINNVSELNWIHSYVPAWLCVVCTFVSTHVYVHVISGVNC